MIFDLLNTFRIHFTSKKIFSYINSISLLITLYNPIFITITIQFYHSLLVQIYILK
jgi:hypothetical protein